MSDFYFRDMSARPPDIVDTCPNTDTGCLDFITDLRTELNSKGLSLVGVPYMEHPNSD